MSDAREALDLLLVYDDDHKPVIDDGLDRTAAEEGHEDKDEGAQASHLWSEGGDQNDMELQRWGVIAPEGAQGDRLLDIVAPLIERRRQQQGGNPVKIYRVPPRMSFDEATQWNKNVFDKKDDLEDDLPRYQLMLGDLHQMPVTLQHVQSAAGYVGRLAFEQDDDYARYVAKVLAWENKGEVAEKAPAIFHTVHDGTRATATGFREMITPTSELGLKYQQRGKFLAHQIDLIGDDLDPDPAELAQAVQGREAGLLFSLSHGKGPPRGGWESDEAQRRRQGAMSFGSAGAITGDDLKDASFLPGGMWFMFACYGAGTPDHSKYRDWLAELSKAGQFRGKAESVMAGIPTGDTRPFIANLPKSVLASENGPLAFYGHVDLAWTYAFQNLDSGKPTSRPAGFLRLLRRLLDGERAGAAFSSLWQTFNTVNGELTTLWASQTDKMSMAAEDRARIGHLWMLRNDLQGYVLLGDPAAQLPVRGKKKVAQASAGSAWAPVAGANTGWGAAPAQQTPSDQQAGAAVLGFQSTAAPAAAPASDGPALPADIDLDTFEETLGEVMMGETGAKRAARALSMERSDFEALMDAYLAAGRKAIGR